MMNEQNETSNHHNARGINQRSVVVTSEDVKDVVVEDVGEGDLKKRRR